jgi:hypothetical protein
MSETNSNSDVSDNFSDTNDFDTEIESTPTIPDNFSDTNDFDNSDFEIESTRTIPGNLEPELLNNLIEEKINEIKIKYDKNESVNDLIYNIMDFRPINIIQYLFKKIKGRDIANNDQIHCSLDNVVKFNDILLSSIPSSRRQLINFTKIAKTMIYNYIYYGFVPGFLSEQELRDKKMDTFYFIWQKEDDPNKLQRPIGLEITNENFSQWKYWSEEQLKVFYFKNVILNSLKQVGLDINPELKAYKDLLSFKGDKSVRCNYYKKYINQYINGNLILPPDQITKIKEFKEEEITYEVRRQISNDFRDYILLLQLFTVKAKQNKIRENLNLKLHKLVNKDKFNRFKWQGLCSTKNLSELELEELQELGLIDAVPGFLTMTKRELCFEFAERFTKLIKSKNEMKNKCFNDTSIITLEELKDIPPEFFFSYTQKDSKGVSRTYCDDIRALNDHFNESNELRNPYTNVPLKESFVNRIKEWYKYLNRITNNMNDEGEIIEVSLGSQLSSKMTSLVSKFIQNPVYHNNGQFFVDSNENTYDIFINKLTQHHILSEQDSCELLGLTQLNLIQRKMMLVDKLISKIRNDTQQMTINGQQAGAIALDIAEIYNNTF